MKIFLLVAVFAVLLMVIGGGAEVQHASELGQIVASDPAPYHLTGGTWSILDLSAPQSGKYAFAQTPDTPPTDAFVTTWRTTAVRESISILVEVHTSGTLTIDWGDGSTPESVTANGKETHTYAASGEYQVSMTGDLSRTWFGRGLFGSTAAKLLSIDQWGDIEWSTMENAFLGAVYMGYRATDAPDLSGVTSVSNMFYNAYAFNGNLSSWNVSSVTDMSSMFHDASSFNQTLNDWDVSSVTNMEDMFFDAASFDQPLNDWNVSSVTKMHAMFFDAPSFNQTLNDWDVSSVTDMSSMFLGASSFNQPLNNWDVSSVTITGGMFSSSMYYGFSSFNQPLNDWNVSKVTNMVNMFGNTRAFNQPLNDWNVSKVTHMGNMFENARAFNQPLNDWNVSKVTDMGTMFGNTRAFNQPLNDWNVSKVTNMVNMFNGATSFNQNLGTWYIMPATANFDADGGSLDVTTVSAQNSALRNHSPVYGIGSGGDSNLFEITGSTLAFKSAPDAGIYSANVTAPGPNVFENGNNWRVLVVKVSSDINAPPVLNTIGDQTANEFVELTFTATASDDDALTFLLDGIVPTGAAITPAGVFTWTPTESQDGDHTITVQVTDGSLTDSETLTVTVNEVNVAPVLNTIGDQTVNEFVELTFTATASDTDVVGNAVNTLTFLLDGTVPTGAAITPAGVFTWTPTESQVGPHDITVQVTDGSLTDSETLMVTVRDVNVAPVLNTIGDQTANEFVELTFTATASDDDALTFLLDGIVPTGAAITPAGVFTWTPTESQDGDHTITVQVTDGSLTDSETLTVTVNEVNVAPVLNTIGDQTVNEFVELTFTATASDTDVVGNAVNTLTFLLDGTVPTGAAITPAGVFTWTPTESQVGPHDITVQVTDGSLTDSETLMVTVRDVNVAPVLNTIGDQTANEFVELTFTATASDDDALTFLLDGIVPTGAAITPAGVFTWTPTESQDGDHTITVQVTDGSLTDSETLTVTVNEVNVAPVLNTIGDQTVNEFVELTFTATASDTDVVGNAVNTLTFLLDGTVPTGAAITPAGVFTWTPTESQVGPHDITVQVTDGSLTDSETLMVTVRDVNVAPVLNTIGDQTANEFVELTFTATASDDDALTFLLDGIVPTGAAITPAGVFTWTPTESQDGDHTITVQVTDGSLTDSETLTVTVNEVNVAPVLNTIGDQTVNEFVELTFTATASDTDVVGNAVNTLTFLLDGTVPTGAAITPAGVFTWIPTESQVGPHDITVQVTDGSLTDSETLMVTVRDVNVAPVLNTIGDQTANEFVELTFTATASDDDALTFLLDGIVPTGAAITPAGVFTWTPTESQDGDHTITVQVTDGSLTDSETLTVTVNEVNVAPVLNTIGDQTVNEFVELTFTATASDTDVVGNAVNTLTFLLDGTVPTGAAITPAGVFTWTPTESQVGPHDITVQVTDGSLTDSETLMVTVRDVNVAPVLNTIGDQTANEFVELTFTATASDDDALTFLLDGIVPTGAAITPAGVFTWTPTESQDGDHTITVQVTDGSLTDSETLTVTVNEVNVAPVLNTIGDQTANEFVELTFTATASDTDVVGNAVNTLTFLLDGTVPTGAAITPAGVFTWTPTESQVGPHDITVQVTDGSLTDSETLMVTVRDVNVAPVLNTIGDQTANEFVELTFTATASDDDALTFLLDGIVPTGAAITPAGVFTWTPTESQDGDHTITVQVTDGSLTDSETLTVTVNEVNVAPVLNTIGDQTVNEFVELTFTATASDTDVVGNAVNTLTFLLDGTVPTGAAITPAGVFTWTPTESQVGPHDITVQVTDGSLTDSETLMVTVRDVNVAPVLNTIGDQTANEFVELTFTATASDDDALTFLLDGIVPTGAAITPAGVFTWTPTESQDGDHTITVQVTDGSLTDSETLTVTVNEVNVAPVLNTIGDQTANEFVELTFTATASDTDVVGNAVNTLTFLLDGTVPTGAAITPAGVFTWTPTESQVGPHDITVQVTDGSLTDSETLMVTVRDVNVAPVLNTIGDQTANEFVELTFTATASDDDALTFLLDGIVPTGAAITPAGVFTWTPTESQDGDHTITVQVTDGSLTDSETLTVTVNEVNVAPVLNTIGDQTVNEFVELTFTATASDTDVVGNAVNTLTFLLDGTVPTGAAITPAGVFTWTPTESQVGPHDITVQVTDGSLTDSETLMVTVRDVNVAPVLTAIEPKDVDELVLLEFNAMATDADNDTLTFSLVGTVPEGASMTPDGAFSWTPDQSQDGDYSITVQVSDGRGGTASEVVDITVHDIAPLPVSARASSSFAIALTLSEVVTSGEQGPNGFSVTTGGDPVLVESITGSDTATLTLNLDGTVSATDGAVRLSYDAAGDVADENGNPLASFSELDVLFSSQRRGGTTPPAVDLGTLAYQRLVDIPPHISEQIASRDDSNPLEPITPDGMFDLPLVINGYGYLLDDVTNTLVPQILTVGDDDPTVITFTVYTQKDLAHFTLYLNLSDENIDYADSDTYITYKNDGTAVVTDPHGYIADATITVTQEDDSMPEKKTVSITLYFDEPMGPTNMVAYMWNTDRKAAFIKIIDAFEVTAVLPESVIQTADPEPLEPNSELPADPEPSSELPADPEPVSTDTLGPDDYDDAQVLHIIRMWSGFESEFITDEQMLASLGLDYPDADIPDWVMTQLGVLVAKGDVTVEEFVLALQYVLENL